jgi:hypothetical protein
VGADPESAGQRTEEQELTGGGQLGVAVRLRRHQSDAERDQREAQPQGEVDESRDGQGERCGRREQPRGSSDWTGGNASIPMGTTHLLDEVVRRSPRSDIWRPWSSPDRDE